MEFPVYIRLFGLRVHPHVVFEVAAYVAGFLVYRHLRRRGEDLISPQHRLWIVVAALVGAALGSKVLSWLVDPADTLSRLSQPEFLMAGKTIVGALVGGLFAVELAKRRMGIRVGTGDIFTYPLILGMCIGRVGCFLSGLPDHTHGVATTLPWGVDFGDGVSRHPTQLYEIVWLGALALWVKLRSRRPYAEGDLFRGFLFGYLAYRFFVEFIKPERFFLGLSAIQWGALLGLVYLARFVPRAFGIYRVVVDEPA